VSGDGAGAFEALVHGRDGSVTMASLARDCLAMVPADGVSLTLLTAGRVEAASASSDGVAAEAQDLEVTLGEGPGVDAFASGMPVLVGDLGAMDGMWAQYPRAAERAGVQAVYAFPLRIGAAKVGLLTLYRSAAHRLNDLELATCHGVAEAVTQVLVGLQSGAHAETLAAALEDGAAFRSVVHQATGVLAARLGCSLEEAVVRLRGTAFAIDRSLPEVAADVVAGRLQIEGS
jgi:GAF domain-containing protein